MKPQEGLSAITNSKNKIFLTWCIAFLVGISIASFLERAYDPWHMLVVLALSLLVYALWHTNKLVRLIVVCVMLVVLGYVRYMSAFPPDTAEYIHVYAENKVTFVGFVSFEPDIRLDGVRYRVRATEFSDSTPVQGEVYMKSGLYPRYRYGEEVRVTCTIRRPEPIEEFRYDRYLARFRTFATCSNPMLESTGAMSGNVMYRGIFSFKDALAAKISVIWHEPYASFVAGLLYGYRGGLGSLNELFNITGVTHIVAISGYNITIISMIFISFARALLIPRKRAFWLVITGIVVFVIFAGASASVVRAGIMGIIVLCARQTGRTSSIATVLILTALIMSVHNPFVFMWDAGFQLSFLSTVGLVYISPLVQPYASRVPEMLGIRESLVSTMSAIFATLPLILYQFGRLSIVAPMVNMLILWIIPWIMIAGAVAATVSFMSVYIGTLLGFVGYAGMVYIVRIVTFFAELPLAAIDMRIPVWLMIISYIGMGWVIWKVRSKTTIIRDPV